MIAAWLGLLGCGSPATDSAGPEPLVLSLHWVQAHDDESWEQARAGLAWNLSLLGVSLPDDGSWAQVAEDQVAEEQAEGTVHLTLDLSGASLTGGDAWLAALAPMREHAETVGSVDVGRFLMRTQFAPWTYLAISEACPTRAGFEARVMTGELGSFAVTDSLLTAGHRQLVFPRAPGAWSEVAFLAMEGEGSLVDDTFEVLEVETVDILPTGQSRFAVYGLDGALRPASDPELSPAGQPGRCMWCHEETLQGVLDDNTPVAGNLTVEEFRVALDDAQVLIDAERLAQVELQESEAHTWGERLAQGFLRPSADRLAREWGVSTDEVAMQAEALGLTRETDPEYPQLGELYSREEIDPHMGDVLEILYDPRELDPDVELWDVEMQGWLTVCPE